MKNFMLSMSAFYLLYNVSKFYLQNNKNNYTTMDVGLFGLMIFIAWQEWL